jgi:DHA2 family multidrug resistance protein-like MFS transporter
MVTTFETAAITPYQRRMAMLALMSAVILATLDTTISNTALPQMARELRSSEAAIIWIANAYQIAMIAGLLPLASLGESVGYRRVFMAGVLLFTSASFICGMSDSFGWVIIGRGLQGFGAAAIMSVNTAFIRHLYPLERLGKGLSLNALVVAVGFTLGPPLASAILSIANWHWLFLFNVPIGLIALPLARRFLPDAAGGRDTFDWVSGLLCAAFLGCLVFAFCSFENGSRQAGALISLVASGACLFGLLKRQATHPAPILALDLLGMPVIGFSSATSVCAFATQALAFVSLPFFLQNTLGVSLISTGLLLTSWPAVVAAMAIVVTPLSDRLSAGVLCSIGLALLSAGMMVLATAPSDTSQAGIALRLVLCGIGFGLFQAPNMKAIMGNAPPHRSGGASGIVAISRLMGQTVGAALVAQCFYLWHQQGPLTALWLGATSAALGVVFSALRLKQQTR